MPLNLRALSVRQPWAELILRGIKTIEVRSRLTKIRGCVQIYASRGRLSIISRIKAGMVASFNADRTSNTP
jgi:predicted transcriptional regulator